MRFRETGIAGAWIVEPEPRIDERGAFTRIFCAEEFSARGVDVHVAQANLSTSRRAGTLRGLHYQLGPSAETKLVRCTRGSLFDVVVDLREGSPTFGRWHGVELSEDNTLALLVPPGCAHGFQTLVDETDALYHVSAAYDPQRERGLHHADPSIGIHWPRPVRVLSERDRRLPRLASADLP